MQLSKNLKNWLIPRNIDRLLLFLFLYLCGTVLATVESHQIQELTWTIWLGISFTFSCLLAWQPWKSWRLWLGLGLFAAVNYLFYQFLLHENYNHSEMLVFDLARDQLALRAIIGFALVFFFGKAGQQIVRLKPVRWVVEKRVRLLALTTLLLLGFYYYVLILDLRPLDLLNVTLLGTPWFWSVSLPCWVVLPPFILGRLFQGWLKYTVAIAVLIACWITVLVTVQRPPTLVLVCTIVMFIHILSLAIVSSNLKLEKNKYRSANLTTLIGAIAFSFFCFSLICEVDMGALFRAQNSERWQYASDVAKLKSLRSKGVRFDLEVNNESKWPNEWFSVEIDAEQTAFDEIRQRFPKTLFGELTVKHAEPEDSLEFLLETEFSLALKSSRISTEQHEYLEGPTLIDTWIIHQRSHKYSVPTILIFESSTLDTTLKSLQSLKTAKFKRQNVIIKTTHHVDDEFWQLISAFEKNPTFEHYPPLIFIEAFRDNPIENKKWYEGIPTDLGLDGTIFFNLNLASGNINQLSSDQIRLILDSKYFFSPTNPNKAISNPNYALHWDLAFAANSAGRFYPPELKHADLTGKILDSKLELINRFHWLFDTNLESSDNRQNGLILPYYDSGLLTATCNAFPNLELLSLNREWISRSGAYNPEKHGPLDDLVKLKKLKQLYIGDDYDVEDIGWTSHLPNLEYLEFFPHNPNWLQDSESDFGFVGGCPNLRTVVLIGEAPPRLILKLIEQPKIEEVILFLSEYPGEEATERWGAELETNSNARKIKVISYDHSEEFPYSYHIPDSFLKHQEQVIEEFRKKLLTEERPRE